MVWDYDWGAETRQRTLAPGGRLSLAGTYPVKISGISFYNGADIDYTIGSGTYNSSGNFYFTAGAGNYGRKSGYPARTIEVNVSGSSGGDDRIRNYTGIQTGSPSEVNSYYSNLVGTFNFEFVNTPPTAISLSRNVRSVTATASGAGGSDAGAPSSYTIQYNDGSGWTGDATSPATFNNLTSGKTYSFRAWANNGVGSSTAYTGGSVYIPNVPSAPNSLFAEANSEDSGSVDLSWSKPASDVAITEYQVYRNSITPISQSNFVGSVVSNEDTISITDTGRTPGSQHKYYVFAKNEMGLSAASVVSNTAYAASIPSAPSSIVGPDEQPNLKVGRSVTINISRDAEGYGNTPTGYFIQFSTDDGLTWNGWNNETKTKISGGENEVLGTSFIYQLLTPALTYKWRAYAKNTIGTGLLTLVTESGVFVSSGGKRWTGSTWSPTESAKRWTGSSWEDITIAKRWSGSNWVDLT